MRIIRVFPRRTSFTPDDALAFVGDPKSIFPDADEVHVSVAFTWDICGGKRLQAEWAKHYSVVRLGGPAFGGKPDRFIPGMYVKHGVTFTSFGCNNACPWCLVPKNEGKLIEINNFSLGWIIQDNNLLQCSRSHIESVLFMLKQQKYAAVFSGGLQASLVNDWFAKQLRSMRIESVFLAADTLGALKPLKKALTKLSFLDRRKLRVYCMIGKEETIEQARRRLEAIWQLGGMPFAQLYQPPEQYIDYSHEWKALVREWSRPAAMFSNHVEEVERQ